jgi:hypothetical protein
MSDTPNLPQPDPALRRLDRLVGTWTMEGNIVGSDEHNIRGQTTFGWLPGGFFLEQRAHIDFIGQQIDALELIGYDPQTDTFPSTVLSGFSPHAAAQPLGCPRRPGDDHGGLRAAGRDLHRFLARGRHLLGRLASQPRRRPDRECPYDIGGHRLEYP